MTLRPVGMLDLSAVVPLETKRMRERMAQQ